LTYSKEKDIRGICIYEKSLYLMFNAKVILYHELTSKLFPISKIEYFKYRFKKNKKQRICS